MKPRRASELERRGHPMNEQLALERAEELRTVLEHAANESDRGITLIIAAHIESCLRRILEAVLIDSSEATSLFEGPYAPFGSLSGKTQATFVLGLIALLSVAGRCVIKPRSAG